MKSVNASPGIGGRRSARRALAGVPGGAALALCAALAGCLEKTQYLHRPGFLADAAGRQREEQMTLPDGTKVVISDRMPGSEEEQEAARHFVFSRVEILDETDEARKAREKKEAEEGIKELQMREETPDGKVILRAFTPEQVLAHMMTCLRNEEYDLLYEQVLDPASRNRWKEQGGPEAWRAWCEENRRELMSTLNRMSFSLLGGDVVLEKTGANVLRSRFAPRLHSQFKFHVVEMSYTADGMKLLSVRE
ncbi:MAG: hypothetical protein U0574_09740 [Phycisphaerales bacterium]